MVKKKGGLSNLMSLITYKKPLDIEPFYIPEINENNRNEKTSKKENDPGSKKSEDEKSSESEKDQNKLYIKKKLKKPILVSELKKQKEESENDSKSCISTDYDQNIKFIKESFNYKNNKDIVIREFSVSDKYKAFIVYIDGMADRTTINDFILRPLLRKNENKSEECSLDFVIQSVIETNQASKVTEKEDVIYEILVGNTCLYIDGCDYYVSSETKGYEKRSVNAPLTEGVVRGAQEGFTENLRTNTTLIRRIIKNKNLSTEFIKIGEKNKSLCAIMYIDGLTNPAIVNEAKRRIESLKTDYISGSGMLEQFIEDNPWSLVPTILTTERPDRAASQIIEGRVAIIAEGTPFALVIPVTITSMFHTAEDTTLRLQYGILLRLIRLFSVFIASFTPGIYVALTNFHREMIPTDLLIAIAKARENVPFPTIVEVLLMEISFELIREAGIRIPGIIGNTIGIIGALILGQAAVQANLVSPVLIIVIAITGLGNFAIPDFSMAFGARIMRLLFIVLGSIIGFYGISLGIVAMITVLANTKSFGIPILSNFAPKIGKSNDLILRKPIWKQEYMPDEVNPIDSIRQPKISRKWTIQSPNVPKKGN